MRERRKYDALKDLYAIIKSVEHLEIAYVKDAVGKDEYTDECNMLLSQFKEAEKVLNTYPDFKDSADFMRKYRMECPRAQDRLLRVGQAATVVMTQRGEFGMGWGVCGEGGREGGERDGWREEGKREERGEGGKREERGEGGKREEWEREERGEEKRGREGARR